MKNLTLLTLAALTVAGCTIQRFPMTNAPVRSQPAYEKTQHSAGAHDTQTVDPVAICGSADNIAQVEMEVLTHQVWMRILTCNIYRPYTVRVYCKNSPITSTRSGPYAKQQGSVAAQNLRQPQPAYQPQAYQQPTYQQQTYQGGYAQQGYYQPQQGYAK